MSIPAYIDGLFSQWDSEQSPGMIVAATHGGETIHRKAYGMADLSHNIPLDFRSVTRIASQSKQFTTLLTLMLEAEGKLSLEDNIKDYIEYLPDYGTEIKIRHLASNTSGLRDILEMMIIGGTPITAPSSRNFARRTASRSQTLNFTPGTDLLYSNTNFLFLTEILEIASGQSFADLLASRITGPLGMPDTRLMARDDEILPRLAVHHRRGPDGNWLKAAWGIAIGGEGGLVSTGDDMLRWLRHLDKPTICDKQLIDRMEAPGAPINGCPSPYGYGLITSGSGVHRSIGHGGWISGSRSMSVRYPEADLGIIILSNHDDFSPPILAEKIAAHILGERRPLAAPQPPTIEPGTYRRTDGDDVFTIEMSEDQLVLTSSMASTPLGKTDDGRWVPQTSLPPFTLTTQNDGTLLAERFGRHFVFRKVNPLCSQTVPTRNATYRSDTDKLSAVISDVGTRLQMRLQSPDGALTVTLHPCEEGFFIARPTDSEAHDQWRFAPWVLPWLFTVRIEKDKIVINSDRTKGLILEASGEASFQLPHSDVVCSTHP